MSVIDSVEFARSGQTLRGSLPIPQLARVKDSLADVLGNVEFLVQGAHDARRRPVLMVEIDGVLHLQCQRCLGLLEFPLRLATTLLLVSAGDAAQGEVDGEDVDWIEASGELDVATLVEDEILLSLPYAPRHAEGLCGQGMSLAVDTAAGSAFAKLSALNRNTH